MVCNLYTFNKLSVCLTEFAERTLALVAIWDGWFEGADYVPKEISGYTDDSLTSGDDHFQ